MEFKGQYLTYQEYKGLGGTLSLTPFNLLEFEARREIDLRTQSRLVNEKEIPEEVKMCVYNLINTLNLYKSEESKAKFIEFLNKIEEMKKMDNDAYVKSLEENYNVYKEEIEGLIEARQAEERINKFVNCFATERKTISTKRKFYQDNLDLVDNEVDCSIVK